MLSFIKIDNSIDSVDNIKWNNKNPYYFNYWMEFKTTIMPNLWVEKLKVNKVLHKSIRIPNE